MPKRPPSPCVLKTFYKSVITAELKVASVFHIMTSDAQILINTHSNEVINTASERAANNMFQERVPRSVVPDMDKIFSSYNKYSPPEGNRMKHYIYGLAIVILILLITIIVVETSGPSGSPRFAGISA